MLIGLILKSILPSYIIHIMLGWQYLAAATNILFNGRESTMLSYKAPLRDMKFLLNDVFDFQTHYKDLSNGENADPETVDMILQGIADFAENVISP